MSILEKIGIFPERTIKLKVDFYADGFRGLEMYVHKDLESQPEDVRRDVITDYIAKLLTRKGIFPPGGKWKPSKYYMAGNNVQYTDQGREYISIITCKRV